MFYPFSILTNAMVNLMEGLEILKDCGEILIFHPKYNIR